MVFQGGVEKENPRLEQAMRHSVSDYRTAMCVVKNSIMMKNPPGNGCYLTVRHGSFANYNPK